MSAIYVNVSKAVPRPYCPMDADVFTLEQWNRTAERFQQAVKERRYTKLLYGTWRGLEHNKDYAYRVVSFICNSTDYNANRVSIKTFNFDPNDPYVFVDDQREYVFLTSDGSLGEYLKDIYFNCNFKPAEIDPATLPDVNSWEYLGPKFSPICSPPKDKLTDLAWCALYYKRPWIFNLGDKFSIYGKAIAEMETKIITGGIEKADWVNPNKSDKLDKTIGDVINDVLPKTFVNDSLVYKISPYDTIDTTNVKCDTSTATIPISAVNRATATSSSLNWNPSTSITTVNIPSVKQVDELAKRVENIKNTINKEKEKEDNKMKMFNFDFGPIKDNDAIRMSPYGIAVKGVNGNYQAYDKANGEMMDVDIINFKADNMFFKMPVAINDIEAGSILIHNRKPMVVFGFSEQGDIIAIDIALGEKKTIMPNKSPFGFNFVVKVVSMFEGFGNTQPDAQHPFGNMLPFLMMGDQSEGFDPMLMCMMMQGQNGCTGMNPMMLYFMSKAKDGGDNDALPFLVMSMMNNK